LHLVVGYFKVATHLCISHDNCISVETAAEEVVYEVVAEPPEPLEQAQQEERRENPAQGPAEPSVEQQPEGKTRCITPNLNYAIYLNKYMCIKFIGVE